MLPRDKAEFPKMLRGIRELVGAKVPAENIVAAVANTLARTRYPMLSRLPGGSMVLSTKPAVAAFARWLMEMDLKDAGFWLGSAYAQLVKADKRQTQAMFFTPPILCDRMLDDLEAAGVIWADSKMIDLACGGAAFLAPAARRMADALTARGVGAEGVLIHIETCLVGIEIDPFLARLSKFFVGMTLYPWVESARRPPIINVVVGDAMKHAPPLVGKFDVVICNPPYRKLASREVAALPAKLQDLCYLQPNLYAMFMALSIQLLNEQGVAGLLTPMSFLSGKSFLRLRTHLAANRQVARIDIVEEKLGVFLGVEQDTAISIYSPRSNDASKTSVFVGIANEGWKKTGNVALDASGGPWILPRCDQDTALLAVANGRTMVDYGYSVIVGDVVLHRDPRRRFPSLKAAQRAKAVKPVPLLRASEIRVSGELEFERQRRSDCFIDVGKEERGIVTGPAIALQRVNSPDQERRLVCAPVPRAMQRQHGGVLGENHVNFLVANNGSAVSPKLLAQILASEPVDRLFRCRSGANNVSVYELSQLPLPDPEVVRIELAAGANIDAAVRAGFGLTGTLAKKKEHGNSRPSRRATKRP